MTEQERQAAFIRALNDATDKYGFVVEARVIMRQYGAMFQVEPDRVVVPLAGWIPPENHKEPAIQATQIEKQ